MNDRIQIYYTTFKKGYQYINIGNSFLYRLMNNQPID